MRKLLPAAALLLASSAAPAGTNPTYKTIQLSDLFYCEGANAGDFNKDGKVDVVSGPFWYEGPDFKQRHEIYKPTGNQKEGSYKADNDYSDNFFAYTHDFNADGWTDYLVLGFPGKESYWFQNPAGKDGHWGKHVIFAVTDNESPTFGDFTGDGKPEIIFHTNDPKVVKQPEGLKENERAGALGYAEPDWSDPTKPWKFTQVSRAETRFQRFTHGLGWGDVNGDGKNDLLEARGWWEQPKEEGDANFVQHGYPFANGGAQMYPYDVDGDGLNDVVTSLNAHGYGLAWHQQKRNEKGEITFTRHDILPEKPSMKEGELRFSQLHAVEFVDMNGDGLKDIVTGKRYFAHGSKGDAEPTANPVLYWFELQRDREKGVQWIPHLIDDNSGVGTQVTVVDVNGDKVPDVVVGSKKGTFVSLSQPAPQKTASSSN
jgi:hypothetical protein